MIGDLGTVFWKEWRSLAGGRARRQLVLTGGVIAVFYAVLFPIQMGAEWVTDLVPMSILAIVLPMVVTGVLIPDAIAGERERHTLATLLSSRLPDRAILYGKLGYGVALGWLGVPAMLALSLIVVNITAARAGLLLYDTGILAGLLVVSLLVALLTGGIAIFVSLRARTAQDAQQMTLLGLMVPFMAIGFGLTLVLSGREASSSIIDWLDSIDTGYVAVAALAVLALIDVLIVWAADRRFRRGRLIAE